jgi:glycogen operon protein
MNRSDCPAAAWEREEGRPWPLGATWIPDARGWNFALYSKHATSVTLLLYTGDEFVEPARTVRLDHLVNKSGPVWHCWVPEEIAAGTRYYAYSVHGPDDPSAGFRFDPGKVLLDPYARAVFFPPGFDRETAKLRGSNAGRAPLGVLDASRPAVAGPDRCGPRHAWDTVIYEMHVRGFTQRENSGVPAYRRGTFAGVIDKIPYLVDLGVTVVELLPVHQRDPQELDYWGYMPLSFFAPHTQYAAAGTPEGAIAEVREMVRALHAAGIEVVLDVVYNHTVEADEIGPTYSYRGIDNTTYYLLHDDRRRYRNDTGTGNVLRAANPAVRRLIVDSLRYWAREVGVDGNRFDLASILTRRSDGSVDVDDPPVVAVIGAAPDLAGLRLIAEPWDLGSYQVGRRFPGRHWYQWNDRFRDDVRAFVRGDPGRVSSLMTRLYGSCDQFPDERADAYRPFQSVNFVTAHDGFCLYDLVSYNEKRNASNGWANADGHDHNLSWNCGHEGDEGAPAEVLALRRRQVKNFCALLLLSNGTPMFAAGDEFMNTQGGNNNPYNQDNETTWLDWSLLERNRDIHRFFKLMIAFRKGHPSIGRSRFWRDDVEWFGRGREVDWSEGSRHLSYCLRGGSRGDRDLYVMVNGGPEDLTFTVQVGEAAEWRRVVDTGRPSPEDIAPEDEARVLHSRAHVVGARSVVVLLRDRGTRPDPALRRQS